MSVYVDDLFQPYGRMVMCHLKADTPAELHAMADTIGLARRWYQGDHYDVSLPLRARAIDAGAIEVSRFVLARMFRGRRLGPPLPLAEARQLVPAHRRDPRTWADVRARRATQGHITP